MRPKSCGVSIIEVPVSSRHSIGKVNRQIQITDQAFAAIRQYLGDGLPSDVKFAMTLVEYKDTPDRVVQSIRALRSKAV